MNDDDWKEVEKNFNELIEMQQKRLLACGRRIVPNLTTDDMLQPNDFIELDNNPLFRYEEGVLIGIKTAQMSLRMVQRDQSEQKSPS
jgi:hypothetical protein